MAIDESPEVAELRNRVSEAEQALDALRSGTADVFVGQTGNVFFVGGSEKPYITFFEAMNEGGVTLDRNGMILFGNPRFFSMLGKPIEALRNTSFLSWIASKDRSAVADLLDGHRTASCDALLETPTGPLFVHISVNSVDADSEQFRCLVVTDLTERAKIEARLLRLQKLNTAIIEADRLISRKPDLSILFQEICRIAVEFGDMKMAWIGVPDDSDQRVQPIASYGEGTDYLDEVLISVRSDIPEGQGPTGAAFRERRTLLVQDFLESSMTKPWHEEGRRYGWASSATFCIQRNKKSYAVLSVYNAEKNAFDAEAASLLEGLAADISHGLDALELDREQKERILFAAARDAEQKRYTQRIEDEHTRLHTLLKTIPDLVWLKDSKGVYVTCNPEFERFFGADEAKIIGKTDYDFVDKDLADSFRQNDLTAMAVGEPRINEDWVTYAGTGDLVLLETIKTPVYDTMGSLVGVLGIARNITQRKQAEEKLRLAASVFSYAREGITITDVNGLIVDVNAAFSRITGYGREEVLGRNLRLLKSGRHPKEFYVAMWHDLIEKGHWYGEIWNRHKNGAPYVEKLTISAVRDEQGNIRHYVGLFSDITAFKEHEKQLEHIAHFDPLTTLPNRSLLGDRLQQAMVQANRRGKRLAVVYLDLDGFKTINDSHGHEAGDQLLMILSARMKQVLREGDTLARIGGDEFVAVLPDLDDVDTAIPLFNRMLDAAAQPVQTEGLFLQVSASLGITFFPQAEDIDADQLLRQGDQAMYQAKIAGKNRYHFFDEVSDRGTRGHHESLAKIGIALTRMEFVLFYQPKVNMRLGTVIGLEALVRWQHPEKGLLPPSEFLPIIENHHLNVELGEWVIDAALTQISLWHAQGLDIVVSVNVSARQFQQTDFVERLRLLLVGHPDVKSSYLEIEILETSALEDLACVCNVIESCRDMGVNFALDDFGTGYSSLTYLKRLPVAQIKIDQSFVHDMPDDPDDLAIVEGVLGLAKAFKLEVIAEGVETVQHGTKLLQLGCDLAQGYGIARPMPADKVADWIDAWRPDSAWINLSKVYR